MANRFVNPVPQFTDSAGNPLLDAELNFFTDGTLTTRKDTFADANEDVDNPNPLPLDGDGRTPNVFYDGTATVQLTNDIGSGQQQVWRADGVGAFGTGSAFDVWNPITEYQLDALVQGSDREYYRSLQNNNSANDPTSSPTFWELIEFLRTWNANVTYGANATAKGSDGLIYRSLAGTNLNNDPTSTTGFWGAPIEFRVQDDLYFIDSELTISSGSVAATKSHHTIDTESDDAADDLNTITVAGVNDFTILFLRLENAARVVTLKHDADNLKLKGNLDIILDANYPAVLQRIGANWYEIERPSRLAEPIVLASKSASSGTVTGNGAVFTVVFNSETKDQTGAYDNTTGIYTSGQDEELDIAANVRVSGITTGTSIFGNIVTTAKTYPYEMTLDGGGAITGLTLPMHMNNIPMSSGDTLKIQVVGNGQGANSMNVSGGSDGRTALSIKQS